MARSSCSRRFRGEVRPSCSRTMSRNSRRELLEVLGVEVGVGRDASSLLGRLEGVVERSPGHVEHDSPEHLDEPAVRVPREALVLGEGDQAVERLLVQAEVQDGVHHPGHRELGARPDTHEERVVRVTEGLAGLDLDLADGLEDVVPEPVGQTLAAGEVVVAGLGGDRESGRDRRGRRSSSPRDRRPCRRAGRASWRRPRRDRRRTCRCSGSRHDAGGRGRGGLSHERRSGDGQRFGPGQVRFGPGRARPTVVRGFYAAPTVARRARPGVHGRGRLPVRYHRADIRRCPRRRPLHRFRPCWRPPAMTDLGLADTRVIAAGRAPVQRVDRAARATCTRA